MGLARRQESELHASYGPRTMRAYDSFEVTRDLHDLYKLGIHISDRAIDEMYAARDEAEIRAVMDSVLQPTVTTASIPTPLQFLQAWAPGQIRTMTAPRKIDDLIGKDIIGSFEDEQVVQTFLELTGTALPYGDSANLQQTSWNINFTPRTVVRFQEGIEVERLEEMRAARVRVNSAEVKREGASLQLNIQRNLVGFKGFDNGANNTYGFLNEPALPNYVTVNTGASGFTTWATKTFQEIIADIRAAAAAIQTNSFDLINPEQVEMTLALATSVYQYLSVTTDLGQSVRDWITKTYPKMRVETAPELNNANGGQNVFYLYAEKLNDTSSDNGRVWSQQVQTVFMVLGIQQKVKGYEEGYANATAGVICKRPFAVYRATGV